MKYTLFVFLFKAISRQISTIINPQVASVADCFEQIAQAFEMFLAKVRTLKKEYDLRQLHKKIDKTLEKLQQDDLLEHLDRFKPKI